MYDPASPTSPTSQPPRKRYFTRKTFLFAGATLLAGGIAVGIIIATSGPGSFTAHGTVEDCTGTLSDGSQVTVLDSAQHVIGTATLATDNSKAAQALEAQADQFSAALGSFGSSDAGMTIYDFTVVVSGGEARYGIQTGSSSHGTIWFSPQEMQKSPGITLGCS